jgi:hypothetical protein
MIASCYRIWGGDFLRIDFHRFNYGVHVPLNDAVRHIDSACLFDFHLSRNQFFLSSEVGVVISLLYFFVQDTACLLSFLFVLSVSFSLIDAH